MEEKKGAYRSPDARKSNATVVGTSGGDQFRDTMSYITCWHGSDKEVVGNEDGRGNE